MGFLESFLNNRQVRKDPSTKYCVDSNKWDRQTKEEIEEQVKDYVLATNRLTDKVDTGYEAMSDTLLTLFKAAPKLRDPKEIRPSYLVNHRVMQEMFEVKELQDARRNSVGDPVATGLAAATLEPELEIIFDKLEKAREDAQRIEQMLEQLEAQAEDLESVMQLANADTEETEGSTDWQEQAAQIEEAMEALKQQIEAAQSGLEQELDGQSHMIKESLEEALGDMNKSNSALQDFDSWGLTPGSLKKMNAKSRMELASKLRTPQFKRMAEVIGRMQRIAFTAQTQKADYAMEEVYELESGNDLARLVPTELLALNNDLLVYDFLHRFVERSLTQYALEGEETVNRGGIIALLDSSSSMTGDRLCWSKAIALALLKIAKMQGRPFHAIEFSSPGLFVSYDFDTTQDELMLRVTHKNTERFHYGADAIIAFAEGGLTGGTCFMTPFGEALDLMDAEFSATGATKADIIFLTDGQAGVSQQFLERFKQEQERMGFKVFGIAIGADPESEPMNTLCDSNVITLKRLTNERDMRPLFSSVGG
jgi:uncharacterized protein with von Willebrand factor type A (vWA) domain